MGVGWSTRKRRTSRRRRAEALEEFWVGYQHSTKNWRRELEGGGGVRRWLKGNRERESCREETGEKKGYNRKKV